MLNGPRIRPKTPSTSSTTLWCSAGTSSLPVIGGTRGISSLHPSYVIRVPSIGIAPHLPDMGLTRQSQPGRSRVDSRIKSGDADDVKGKWREKMPRVPPITGKDDVPAEHHKVVDDVLGVFGRIRGPFSMLLHSPELASKLLPMVPFNRDGTIVEPVRASRRSWRRCASGKGPMSGRPRSPRRSAPGTAGDDRPAAGQGRSVLAAAGRGRCGHLISGS